jgi:hypothetical protein
MLSVNHGQTLQCKEPGAAKPQPNKKSNITTKEGTKSTKFMTKNIRTLRVSRRLIRPLAEPFRDLLRGENVFRQVLHP